MILVDTGPLVALFDRKDPDHLACATILKQIEEALCTTTPVLTETFQLLSPASIGAQRLMDFITRGGLEAWHLDNTSLTWLSSAWCSTPTARWTWPTPRWSFWRKPCDRTVYSRSTVEISLRIESNAVIASCASRSLDRSQPSEHRLASP